MEQEQITIKQVGQKIKKLRELRNYTQEYMAKRLGLSLNGYGKIEREETELTLRRLQEISQILEVKVFDLLDFDENKVIFNQTANESPYSNVAYQFNEGFDKERKQYEARIRDLQTENQRLHTLLEKALTK